MNYYRSKTNVQRRAVQRVCIALMCFAACCATAVRAEKTYLFELGPTIGASVLIQDPVGDNLAPHPAYGGMLRYKPGPRWAFSIDGTYTGIAYHPSAAMIDAYQLDDVYKNNLLCFDLHAEYNFFKLTRGWIDRYSRAWSPYLYAGMGFSVQSEGRALDAYLPFGFGFKWKLAERLNLTLAWKGMLFVNDGIEGVDLFNDPYGLQSRNFLEHDLLQTLMVGFTINFWRTPRGCVNCSF